MKPKATWLSPLLYRPPKNDEPVRSSRPRSTGRFATRKELCECVWDAYLNDAVNQIEIASRCGVSQTTVSNIIRHKEGYPDDY